MTRAAKKPSARERDRQLIARGGTWRVPMPSGLWCYPSAYHENATPISEAAARELNRISREERAKASKP